jgi:hypothetical protein
MNSNRKLATDLFAKQRAELIACFRLTETSQRDAGN